MPKQDSRNFHNTGTGMSFFLKLRNLGFSLHVRVQGDGEATGTEGKTAIPRNEASCCLAQPGPTFVCRREPRGQVCVMLEDISLLKASLMLSS